MFEQRAADIINIYIIMLGNLPSGGLWVVDHMLEFTRRIKSSGSQLSMLLTPSQVAFKTSKNGFSLILNNTVNKYKFSYVLGPCDVILAYSMNL